MGFDPYFDWAGITPELTAGFLKALTSHNEFRKKFEGDPTPENLGAYLKVYDELQTVHDNIMRGIYTVPAMVHVAGARKRETHPDDPMQEAMLQRCARCGSVLHVWHEHAIVFGPEGPQEIQEEDVPWWDEGQKVAKASQPGQLEIYEVEPDRELEKHERMCVSLSDLDFS